VCFLVIYFPSCCSQYNLDQWYHSNLLFVVSLCMSPMRLGYWELGLELVELGEEHSYWSKQPPMIEEKRGKNGRRSYQTIARGSPHVTKEPDDG
jgi:hypothetical protein